MWALSIDTLKTNTLVTPKLLPHWLADVFPQRRAWPMLVDSVFGSTQNYHQFLFGDDLSVRGTHQLPQ